MANCSWTLLGSFADLDAHWWMQASYITHPEHEQVLADGVDAKGAHRAQNETDVSYWDLQFFPLWPIPIFDDGTLWWHNCKHMHLLVKAHCDEVGKELRSTLAWKSIQHLCPATWPCLQCQVPCSHDPNLHLECRFGWIWDHQLCPRDC